MRKPRFVALLLIAVLCRASLPGRADDKKDDVNEIGDRKVAHRSIISQEKEIAIGKQYADQIDKQAKILKDPVINEYVNRVAQNLARNSDLTIPLTIKVIDDPAINAFTLPGGFMYLNTGTLTGGRRGRPGGWRHCARDRPRCGSPLGQHHDQGHPAAICHDPHDVHPHVGGGLYGRHGSLHERRAPGVPEIQPQG